MSDADWRNQLSDKIFVMQIIAGAMSFGCLMLLIMTMLLKMFGQNNADQSALTYIGLAAAGMTFCVWLFFPGALVSQGRKKIRQTLLNTVKQAGDNSTDIKTETENKIASQLMALFHTKMLLSCALLEGPVFLLFILYIAEGYMPCVFTGVVMMILLAAQIPTVGRVTAWIENQLRLVDEERFFE